MLPLLFSLFLLLDVVFIVVACRTKDALWAILAGADFVLLATMLAVALLHGA